MRKMIKNCFLLGALLLSFRVVAQDKFYGCYAYNCMILPEKIEANIDLFNRYEEQIEFKKAQRDKAAKDLDKEIEQERKLAREKVRSNPKYSIDKYDHVTQAAQVNKTVMSMLEAEKVADQEVFEKYQAKKRQLEVDERHSIEVLRAQQAIEFSSSKDQENLFRALLADQDHKYCARVAVNPPSQIFTDERLSRVFTYINATNESQALQAEKKVERFIQELYSNKYQQLSAVMKDRTLNSLEKLKIQNQLQAELRDIDKDSEEVLAYRRELFREYSEFPYKDVPKWETIKIYNDCTNSNKAPLLSEVKDNKAPLSDTVLSSDLDPLYELKAFSMSCLTEEEISEKCKLYPNLVELGLELILSNEQALATSKSIVSSVQNSKDQEKLQDANIEILENLQTTTEVQQAVVENALAKDKNIPEEVAQDLAIKNKELKESSEQLSKQISSVKEQKDNFYIANGSLYSARKNYVESGSRTADYKPAEVNFESESAVVAQSENVQREVKEDRSIAQVEQIQTSCSGGSDLTNIGGRKIFQYPSPEEFRNKIKITSDSPAASSINCKNACGIRGASSWAWASGDNICFCGSSSSESYDYLKGMIGGNCSKQE